MARFSDIFGIGLSQAQLDFVDIDAALDNRFYVDPYAIQIRDDEWSSSCGDHIRSFFNEVLDALRCEDDAKVDELLNNLHEPNETCFGQSRGVPSGRGVGQDKARDLADALRRSRAFNTGLLSDVSEAELFIANVGSDTISDLTTNVLRGLLAQYTAQQCALYGVPMQQVGNIGPTWSVEDRHWHSVPLLLPVAVGKPLLLVPKYSVRLALSLNSQEFWNHHMIEFLRQEHLRNGTSLVKVFRKSGRSYVTKKSVKERHPFIKDDLASFAQDHPEILETYKALKGAKGPLKNEDFDERFDEAAFARLLIERLPQIAPGNAAASEYHTVSMGICTFLFYPQLITPIKEREIHQGRKRIDIKYTNSGQEGFFGRMLIAPQTRAVSVLLECKNYSRDIENPEFDQLTGRFGHQRGFFGILLCRSLADRQRIVSASRDAVNDGRGYMLILEDRDLVTMLEMVEAGHRNQIDSLLQDRYDEIIH